MTSNSETIMYVGGAEYLFVNVEKFEVNSEPADPTTYTPKFQFVAMGGAPVDANWRTENCEWVIVDGEDKVRLLAENVDHSKLAAGHYWVFIKLSSMTEDIIRPAGGLHVRTSA